MPSHFLRRELCLAGAHLVGNDLKVEQAVLAEYHCYRHIPCVASAPDNDSPDSTTIMTSIEGVPAFSKVNLKPGAEIHWVGNWRDADISQVTGYIARGDIHASAERDRKVCEIAANSDPFAKCIEGCPGRTRLQIVKTEMVVYKIANGLDSTPSEGSVSKRLPGEIEQFAIHFAIPARQDEFEGFDRHLLHIQLGCRGSERVRPGPRLGRQ